MEKNSIRKNVREKYGKIAAKENLGCGCSATSCCSSTDVTGSMSKAVGYSDAELETIPEEANLGLGCGNPVALASLNEGETVLDLGSGGGIDCFLAAQKVGEAGSVIGVDMTPEMIEKARENAKKGGYSNVEFRLGEIEHLPVQDTAVDCILSNCVINLSPEKENVFSEAYRVLKPGGRLMISDIVITGDIPEIVRNSIDAYVGCIAGAVSKESYLEMIENAGFHSIKIMNESTFPIDAVTTDPIAKSIITDLELTEDEIQNMGKSVTSIKVYAKK